MLANKHVTYAELSYGRFKLFDPHQSGPTAHEALENESLQTQQLVHSLLM